MVNRERESRQVKYDDQIKELHILYLFHIIKIELKEVTHSPHLNPFLKKRIGGVRGWV